MDRLKLDCKQLAADENSDLHSNMDRLKLGTMAEIVNGDTDLHSNMDRLKRTAWTSGRRSTIIYIPIWID